MATVQTALLLEQTSPPPVRQWTVAGRRLTIGRDPDNDVEIDDPLASRHHAELLQIDGSWSIVDRDSANGTFVNDTEVTATAVHGGDRIRIGHCELVLIGSGPGITETQAAPVTEPPPPPPPPPPPAVSYNIPSQHGTNYNVAGDQYNHQQWIQYREGTLAYIANRRGVAKQLLIWGVVVYLGGTALGLVAILSFQKEVFDTIDSQSTDPPDLPDAFVPMFGAGALLALVGLGLVIFGLIVRSGAKRKERQLEGAAPWQTTSGT